jgi:hypothetical protein
MPFSIATPYPDSGDPVPGSRCFPCPLRLALLIHQGKMNRDRVPLRARGGGLWVRHRLDRDSPRPKTWIRCTTSTVKAVWSARWPRISFIPRQPVPIPVAVNRCRRSISAWKITGEPSTIPWSDRGGKTLASARQLARRGNDPRVDQTAFGRKNESTPNFWDNRHEGATILRGLGCPRSKNESISIFPDHQLA